MNVRILNLVEGAKQATGATVIIDVFRAMSVEAYIMALGAAKIYPVGDQQIAYDLKAEHPEYVLIGERKGVMLPGFDFGNSPTQIADFDFRGKTVVHTTSAGTQGIANARSAEVILTGSLVNAKAVADYILREGFETISLVCMGLLAQRPIEEDTLCAEYIRSLLLGEPLSGEELSSRIEDMKHTSGAKFFDMQRQEVYPQGDFFRCTELNRFPFVLKVEREAETGLDVVRRI